MVRGEIGNDRREGNAAFSSLLGRLWESKPAPPVGGVNPLLFLLGAPSFMPSLLNTPFPLGNLEPSGGL